MSTYSALIIDDEIENVELLKIFIQKYCKQITTIYYGTSLSEATNLYLEHKPNILFLDILLGNESNSFTFIENCCVNNSEVIFVSSYEEYALKAISFNVAAYLVKPIQIEQLVKAVDKAVENLQIKNIIQNFSEKNNFHKSDQSNIIYIPSVNKIDFIHDNEIIYLEAEGRYTVFHLLDNKKITAVKNIGEYEKTLNSSVFFRVHHKYIVNLNMILNINKAAGNYCEMKNKIAIPIAKRRQEELYKFLKIK